MTGVWPQLEPILGKVAKPARYIGLEDGARIPQHAPHKVAWLLAYPDTYEVGLSNQGLQILYEILNEREDTRRSQGVQMKWHGPKATLVEGVMSRGDRRVGDVIESVWRRGGTFQEWNDRFDLDLWLDAMASYGLDPDWYTHRHRTLDEVLPWDHRSAGLDKDFLWEDWQDSLAEVGLPDCWWTPCYDCGACTGYSIEHIVASAIPPAGGSQGTGQDLSSSVPVMLLGRRPELVSN